MVDGRNEGDEVDDLASLACMQYMLLIAVTFRDRDGTDTDGSRPVIYGSVMHRYLVNSGIVERIRHSDL